MSGIRGAIITRSCPLTRALWRCARADGWQVERGCAIAQSHELHEMEGIGVLAVPEGETFLVG